MNPVVTRKKKKKTSPSVRVLLARKDTNQHLDKVYATFSNKFTEAILRIYTKQKRCTYIFMQILLPSPVNERL